MLIKSHFALKRVSPKRFEIIKTYEFYDALIFILWVGRNTIEIIEMLFFFTFCSPELLPNCKFSLHVPFISVEKPQKHWKKFNKKKKQQKIYLEEKHGSKSIRIDTSFQIESAIKTCNDRLYIYTKNWDQMYPEKSLYLKYNLRSRSVKTDSISMLETGIKCGMDNLYI